MIEIKGPGDQIRANQNALAELFEQEGIPASILRVECAGLNPTKRPRYQLGVTQLVSWFLTTSLTAESGDDGVSAREGMAAHQRVQRSWPESIQREVRLRPSMTAEICRTELSGRADGPEATPERLRILEIKTCRQPLETLSPAKTELHWLQARVCRALATQPKPGRALRGT
ncbi:MAG: hypothetical protein IPM37_22930 [Hahellaceae bacterium]|nr:hypothetical protein [Hahellaceae bacterium]